MQAAVSALALTSSLVFVSSATVRKDAEFIMHKDAFAITRLLQELLVCYLKLEVTITFTQPLPLQVKIRKIVLCCYVSKIACAFNPTSMQAIEKQ